MVTNAHPAEHLTGDSASQRDLPYIDLVDAQGNVQRSLALGERGVTIGSAPGNLLVLDGPSVARSHVRIDWDGQSAAVQNLATRRPTLYEGSPLQANDLRVWQPGELLQVGDYRLKLRLGGAAGDSENSSASQATTPLSAIAANGADANSLLDLRLDSGYDLLELTPDQMVAVKLTLTNRGTTPETAIISVEGPAAAWVRLPPTPVQVRPMGSVPLMLPVTVLRKPENRAGEYEVVIRARGQSSPSNSASAIGRWTVLPFSDARLELRPPTLKVRGTNSALYTVSMRNLGNVSMPFELRLTDDQQQLEFAPNISSGVIEPGATDERKVEVLPLRQPDDKEQTYNVRVQAAANGQTYSDSSTLIQRRGDFPEWAKWVLGGLFLLALLAIPALFLAYRTNAQNNANGTQVAMMEQTRNSMLTFEERTGTAASMGTQTVVAQTLQAVNAGVVNGPTSTVLSQLNATAIAGSAQLTAQAAMIASSQAKPGNSTTNNNFFGDGVGGNSPAQATLGAVLQALQAASGQVSGAQTSQALQAQAGQIAQTSVAQSGQTSTAQSNSTAQVQATTSANTQGTQAAQTSVANATNVQSTQAVQTNVAQTASAAALQTAVAQTNVAQTADTGRQNATQTSNAINQQTAIAQQTSVVQTGVASTATAAATTATATAIFGTQPRNLLITSTSGTARAGTPFEVKVIIMDNTGKQATTTGNGFLVTLQLSLNGVIQTTSWPSVPSKDGAANFTDLKWNISGDYQIVAKATNLIDSAPAPLKITPASATKFVFKCFITEGQQPPMDCLPNQPTPFVVTADQKFGFIANAVDTYGNVDTSFQGPTYVKMATVLTDSILIGNLPPFNNGTVIINSILMTKKGVGTNFFFEYGVTAAANSNIPYDYSPAFTMRPGGPVTIEATPSVTQPIELSRIMINPPPPTFKVIVKDRLDNPVLKDVRVCFKTTATQNNNPDLNFMVNFSFDRGRDGFKAFTNDSGIAESPAMLSNGRQGTYDAYAYSRPDGDCDKDMALPPPSGMPMFKYSMRNLD